MCVIGRDIDVMARVPLWRAGLDYRHGTGHGIGAFLSVHEGKQCFCTTLVEELLCSYHIRAVPSYSVGRGVYIQKIFKGGGGGGGGGGSNSELYYSPLNFEFRLGVGGGYYNPTPPPPQLYNFIVCLRP